MAPRTLLVAGLAALALLAGCLNAPLSEAEAAERAELAVQSLASAMSRGDEGDIKRMSGSVHMTEGSDEFAMGPADLDMEIVWAQDGVVRFTIGSKSGGFTMELVAYCTPTQTLIVWGDTVYGSRPQVSGDGDELCNGMEETEGFSSAGALFGSEEFAELEQDQIETHADGSITATYTDPEGGTYTFFIDRKGRITRMEMSAPDGEGAFDIEYGARDRIDVPAPTARIAANAYFTSTFDAGTYRAEVSESPEEPALDEVEIHITTMDWESGDRTVQATFPASMSTGTDGDWSYTFTDADGDGRLSVGDTFTVTNSAWTSEWDYDIELYDTWAAAYANEGLPGPGIALLLIAGLGLAGWARRRR